MVLKEGNDIEGCRYKLQWWKVELYSIVEVSTKDLNLVVLIILGEDKTTISYC